MSHWALYSHQLDPTKGFRRDFCLLAAIQLFFRLLLSASFVLYRWNTQMNHWFFVMCMWRNGLSFPTLRPSNRPTKLFQMIGGIYQFIIIVLEGLSCRLLTAVVDINIIPLPSYRIEVVSNESHECWSNESLADRKILGEISSTCAFAPSIENNQVFLFYFWDHFQPDQCISNAKYNPLKHIWYSLRGAQSLLCRK